MMAIWIALHTLAAVIWVGGMFFAWMLLRPAVIETLQPPERPRLWLAVLRRFFPWIWLSIAVLLASGHGALFQLGGMAVVGWHVHAMYGLGLMMMAIFAYVYFAPFARLRHAVEAGEGNPGSAIATIRRCVGINLLLGLIVVVLGAAGRYF